MLLLIKASVRQACHPWHTEQRTHNPSVARKL
jgi:hypothetical protein